MTIPSSFYDHLMHFDPNVTKFRWLDSSSLFFIKIIESFCATQKKKGLENSKIAFFIRLNRSILPCENLFFLIATSVNLTHQYDLLNSSQSNLCPLSVETTYDSLIVDRKISLIKFFFSNNK